MLRREDELRLSDETLRKYQTHGQDAYVAITTALQEQVAREFGLEAPLGVMLLRTADSFARDSAELAEIVSLSLYRRHNRCVDGDLSVGNAAPMLTKRLHLLDAACTEVDLFDYLLSGLEHRSILPRYVNHPITSTPTHSIVSRGVLKTPVPLILFAGSYS